MSRIEAIMGEPVHQRFSVSSPYKGRQHPPISIELDGVAVDIEHDRLKLCTSTVGVIPLSWWWVSVRSPFEPKTGMTVVIRFRDLEDVVDTHVGASFTFDDSDMRPPTPEVF